jgi:sulfur carrier protein ThiS
MSILSTKYKRITVEESKTARELLVDLELSTDHVVLVEGKRIELDAVINENTLVIVLPLIAGG